MESVLHGFIGAGLFFGVFFLFCFVREKMEERDTMIAFRAVDDYRRTQTLKEVADMHRKWEKEAEARKAVVKEEIKSQVEEMVNQAG
jgi:hypothetical protein